jgi:transcriptional activator SPT7
LKRTNANASEGHKPPPSFEPVTRELIKSQIGLVQNFFLAKLHANNDEPLVEDEDLPVKQRPPKPRLPPTGKISMPRKRPLQGQGGSSKKKKKPNPPVSIKGQNENNKKEPISMERSASKMSEQGDDVNGGVTSP